MRPLICDRCALRAQRLEHSPELNSPDAVLPATSAFNAHAGQIELTSFDRARFLSFSVARRPSHLVGRPRPVDSKISTPARTAPRRQRGPDRRARRGRARCRASRSSAARQGTILVVAWLGPIEQRSGELEVCSPPSPSNGRRGGVTAAPSAVSAAPSDESRIFRPSVDSPCAGPNAPLTMFEVQVSSA